ncbi:MAG: rod shape-determining protein MreD [Sporichthyaceae bacterium]|nr:rod shape-determining protein MreD [Sporichthyaceae bacterium]
MSSPTLSGERLGRMSTAAILGAVAMIVVAAVVQVSMLTRLPLPGATPGLVLLVLIGLALSRGSLTGALAGFGAGMVLDLMPPADHAVGRYAFVLCLIGYLLGLLGSRIYGTAIGLMAVTAVTSAAAFIGFAATGALTGDPRANWSDVWDLLPSAVLYTTALAPFVVRSVLSRYRPLTRGELGTVVTARKARRLNPLARRQERML